ncbi:hypothetical protein [Leucobacter chromiireducens]|uniref:hypothetical protein n=1 Tax=Leucobacter chromiireducens TaxID=283877 RepID=UPI000F643334|nr:hypothetical protein [Leucobacter chromiireducens]
MSEAPRIRTCAQPVAVPAGGHGACGRDCEPEPFSTGIGEDGPSGGIRIAFVCPEHGLHSVVDPFEGRR